VNEGERSETGICGGGGSHAAKSGSRISVDAAARGGEKGGVNFKRNFEHFREGQRDRRANDASNGARSNLFLIRRDVK
jgi:hypothetical protein